MYVTDDRSFYFFSAAPYYQPRQAVIVGLSNENVDKANVEHKFCRTSPEKITSTFRAQPGRQNLFKQAMITLQGMAE